MAASPALGGQFCNAFGSRFGSPADDDRSHRQIQRKSHSSSAPPIPRASYLSDPIESDHWGRRGHADCQLQSFSFHHQSPALPSNFVDTSPLLKLGPCWKSGRSLQSGRTFKGGVHGRHDRTHSFVPRAAAGAPGPTESTSNDLIQSAATLAASLQTEAVQRLSAVQDRIGELEAAASGNFEQQLFSLGRPSADGGIGIPGPAETFDLIDRAVSGGLGDLAGIVRSNVDGVQAAGSAVLSRAASSANKGVQAAEAAVASNPTMGKLVHSASAAIQSAGDLGFHVASQLESVAAIVREDPSQAAMTAHQFASEAIARLATSTVAQALDFTSQPGVLPAIGAATGAVLGIGLGNAVVWLTSEEGQDLPKRYNPAAIAAYFQRRPAQVLSRSAKIFAEVSVLVTKVFVDRAAGQVAQNERERARELVDLITRLGPTAIKVGQALSIRPDLLSLAYLEELQTLQDRVPPFSNEEARRIIREGLGRPAEEVFMEMSPEPVAAASLGQVYKARLRETGDVVAVKVQRPGVLEEISCDLFVLRLLAGALQRLPTVYTDLEEVLDNWARRFFDELDYVQEGRNAIRFAEDMRLLKNVTVPPVFQAYTARKVLTSGWVEGEKLSESRAPDLGTLVTTALNCYLIQLLETGFLHADPHPGNLLRTPDGRLCVLDFGLMTEVTKEQQYALIEYISHLVNNDFEAVAQDLVVLGFVPPELVDPEKTAAVVPQLSRVLGQLVQGGGARYVNIAQVTDDLSKMAEDYVFVIPPYFALILRAFGVLEGIGLDNDPNYAIVEECYPYISKRLITDDSPRARAALRYFLYGKSERLDVARVESIVNGFQSFRELMAPVEGREGGSGAAVAVAVARKPGVDPAAREALQLVFSPEGSYLQELLLTELVRAVDALSREALAAAWGFFAARAVLPLPASLTTPGTYPLPLPGMVAGIVRGEWVTGRLSEEDQQQLLTVRRLWTLLEPQLSQTATPASPADFAELARDVVPIVRDMWPGMATAAQRFLIMLLQRQALRLADDLDGRSSVAEWEKDPAALARLVRLPGFLTAGGHIQG